MNSFDRQAADFLNNEGEVQDGVKGTISRILAGNPDLFVDLLNEVEGSLSSFLYNLTYDHAETEELAQQTRLQAFERLDTYRGEGTFKAWVLAIALNVFRRSHRVKKRHVSLNLGEESLLDEMGNPMRQIIHREMQWCIRHVLYHHINETNRLPLILRDVQGLSYKDVATVTGLSGPAVKSRIHRGRRQFLDHLERTGCAALVKDYTCYCTGVEGI